MSRTIWHIVNPDTMLIMGRRFSRAAALDYAERYTKTTGREVKVLRSDISLKQGYRNAVSRW
jgi:hypothetical protein